MPRGESNTKKWINANRIEQVSAPSHHGVDSVVAGTNVTVDSTDPHNPVVASTGSGSGFPVTFDDGTWTYSFIQSSGTMTLEITKNSDPTHISAVVVFDTAGPDIDVRTRNTGATGDINLRAKGSVSLLADSGDAGLAATLGNVVIQAGTNVKINGLPTSDPGVSGALYTLAGIMHVSP